MNWRRIICIGILVLCAILILVNAVWYRFSDLVIRINGIVMLVDLLVLYNDPNRVHKKK